jgi:hypothetical protein
MTFRNKYIWSVNCNQNPPIMKPGYFTKRGKKELNGLTRIFKSYLLLKKKKRIAQNKKYKLAYLASHRSGMNELSNKIHH